MSALPRAIGAFGRILVLGAWVALSLAACEREGSTEAADDPAEAAVLDVSLTVTFGPANSPEQTTGFELVIRDGVATVSPTGHSEAADGGPLAGELTLDDERAAHLASYLDKVELLAPTEHRDPVDAQGNALIGRVSGHVEVDGRRATHELVLDTTLDDAQRDPGARDAVYKLDAARMFVGEVSQLMAEARR